MRVRVRMEPIQEMGKVKLVAVVESRSWFNFQWQYKSTFYGDSAHDRALTHANLLKNPGVTEC